MALGNVTFGGLATGLPSDIVDQLMKTEQARLKAFQRDQTFYTNQKSTYTELGTKLSALSSTATTLQSTSSWSPHQAVSSDEDVVAVTASSSAVAGTHAMTVSRLATSQTLMTTSGVTSLSDTVSTTMVVPGSFSFNYNGKAYTNTDIGIAQGDTLADVATKISNYAYKTAAGVDEAGISASVLYDGSSYRLALSAKDQGALTRNSDGTTATSRLDTLNMDLGWATGDTMTLADASAALTGGDVTGVTAGTIALNFTYGGTAYTNGDFSVVGGDTLASIVGRINAVIPGLASEDINATTDERRLVLGAGVSDVSINLDFANGDGAGTAANLNTTRSANWKTSANSSGVSIGAAAATKLTNAAAQLTAATQFDFTYRGTSYGIGAIGIANGDTLSEIADRITGMNVSGLRASVVNDGYQDRLVLEGTSDISGLTVNLGFADGGGTGVLATLNNANSKGYFQTDIGLDAHMKVDGLSNIYSSSNTVSDVMPGVTMTLKQTSATPITVTITNDTATVKSTLEAFTTAYNDVVKYVAAHKTDTLSGSSLARSVVSQIRGELNKSTYKGDTSGDVLSPFSILAELGLRTDQKTGEISFSSTTLDTALAANFNALSSLFTNTQAAVGGTNNAGLAYRFEDLIDGLTNSSGGALTGTINGTQARIDRLTASITREQARLEKVRERMTLRFSNLEQLVNSLNSKGSAMTSALSKL